MAKKIKSARFVTFKEDYKIGNVSFKKDSVHAMHADVAQKLVDRKVKVEVKEINEEKLLEEKKAEFEKAKKEGLV